MVEEQSYNNKRIAKNTIYLYFRMICLLVINLYTSRVVLKSLGVDDFGIYNVVGGFVSMFAILSNTLTASISRYITFELGKNDLNKLKKIYSSSLTIQVVIAIIVFMLAEIGGIWFLNYKMTFNPHRYDAAFWVLQSSIFAFCIDIIKVPFKALIIAHERMNVFAYISVFDAILILCLCMLLSLTPYDVLITYAVFMALDTLIMSFVYYFYSNHNFEECSFCLNKDKVLYKELLSFSGWSFIGGASSVLRDQGGNILLNIFWGTVANAARGVSTQVSTAVTAFSNNIVTAINPQITKQYAMGNLGYAFNLVILGARFSTFFLLFVSLPIFMEAPAVLDMWLYEVPQYSVLFVRLVIVFTIVENLSYTMITLMLATGKIRNYQLVVGGTQLLNLPVAYAFLKFGFGPEWIFIVAIFISIMCLILRLIMLKKMINFPVIDFSRRVLLSAIIVVIGSLIAPFLFKIIFNSNSLLFVALDIIVCVLSVGLFSFFGGCNKHERSIILGKLSNVLKR